MLRKIIYGLIAFFSANALAEVIENLNFNFDISGDFNGNQDTIQICSSLKNDNINNSTLSSSDGSETAGIVLSSISNLSDTSSTNINVTISDNLDAMPPASSTFNKNVFKAAFTITNPGTDSNNQMFKDKIDLSASPTQVNLSNGNNMYMNPNNSGNLAIKGLFDVGHMDVDGNDTGKEVTEGMTLNLYNNGQINSGSAATDFKIGEGVNCVNVLNDHEDYFLLRYNLGVLNKLKTDLNTSVDNGGFCALSGCSVSVTQSIRLTIEKE